MSATINNILYVNLGGSILNKSYYSILVSQATTNLGFALYTMSVTLFLFNTTESTAITSLITFVSIIARMLGSATLPIFSNRIKFRTLLITSQIVQLLFLSSLLFVYSRSYSSILLFYSFVIIGVVSFFNGWFSPLKSTIVKSIVSKDKRVQANSLLSTVDQTFQFVAWAFGGLLLAFLGKSITLEITLCLILISLISFLSLRTQDNSKEQINNDSLLKSLTNGWSYLFKNPKLRVLIIMDLIESWAGMIWIAAISLAFVKEALHKGEPWWGYINGAYYLGTMIGGFIIYRLSKKLQGNLLFFMFLGATLYGALTFIYGFISNPIIALIAVVFMGPAYILRDLSQETIFQNEVDEQTLSKIMSARSAMVQFIFMLSVLAVGTIAEVFGARFVYISAGSLLLISAMYGSYQLLLKNKKMEHKENLNY